MLKRNIVRWVVLSAAMVAACGLMSQRICAAEPNAPAARIDSFAGPDGTSYFALSLKPAPTAPTAGPRDIVVLVNTSASQVGIYRAKATEALKSFLASLPAGDRVQLIAVDVYQVPLSKGFVAPGSQEMNDALAALNLRTPLGTTDMAGAVNTAVDSFANSSANQRAVVYLGDGRSRANLLDTDGFAKLAARLAGAHIAMTSYDVGPRPDEEVLGSLAVQSGGTVIHDTGALEGAAAGRELAAATEATVIWPTAINWPAEVSAVFPKLVPLRSDRDSIFVGTLKGKGPFTVQVAADSAAPQKIEFAVPATTPDDTNSYLAPLVDRARLDGGLSLPLVGAGTLADLRQAVAARVRNLTQLAHEALVAGNVEGADQMASAALRQDPNDPEAQTVKRAAEKARQGAPAVARTNGGPGVPPPPVAPAVPSGPPPAAGDLNIAGQEPPAGEMAEEFQRTHRVITQATQTQIQNVLDRARRLMASDPEVASQELRLELDRVRQIAELDPDVRDQLVDRLQTALREAARRRFEVEQAREQRLATQAAARERMMINETLLRKQEKAKQLMDRFDSLMQEGHFQLAEEVAGQTEAIMHPVNPERPQGMGQAALTARFSQYLYDALTIRLARQKGVVDTLYQSEKSSVPTPDEPPILYPDAEVWQQLTARRVERYRSMDLARQGPAEKKIHDALKSTTQLEFIETPLQDVIDYMKDTHKIEIQLDKQALQDLQIEATTPVSVNLRGITLKSALKLMLRDISKDLTYIIEDEVLLITTKDEAELRLKTKVYPVADLVLPIPPPGSMMGGMGMGGMGGGGMGGGMMGGMGGGMMGGGMGGGMMGGMGGMGGGGGMWNVPHNVPPQMLPRIPAGGFQAFSVKDDLNVPSKAATGGAEKTATGVRAPNEAPTAPAATAAVDKRPATIDVKVEQGVSPDLRWEKYFATTEPQPKAVRDTVRRLKADQKFDEMIAVMSAALRHGQGQPWMYEVLAIAMEAAKRPPAEIERVLVSAVEFVDNTADLLYIGAYLSRNGMHRSALEIYRQAARLDPIRPETYMLALKAAREMNDLEGLKWASVGILSQAWTKEHADVWQAGVGVAREVLDKLRAQKQDKEADALLRQLDDAVARDCAVVVKWTGEADVDLLVQEPSGTVCSLRDPRTTGGGVMVGDDIRQAGRDAMGGHSIGYVCPKGFDGKYRLLVRRVWGNVVNGKVSVEVATHLLAPGTIDVQKWIPLSKDEAMVVFELNGGRRKEPLGEQQLANTVNSQLAFNRQVVNRQLASSMDSTALADLGTSRGANPAGGGQGGFGGNPWAPFFGGGAVGYAPVITVLPEGAMMSVTAVVSADRRYVRISCGPFFSGIGQVSTFNYATGGSGTSNGGTGGQGFSGGGFGGGSGGGFGGGGGGGFF